MIEKNLDEILDNLANKYIQSQVIHIDNQKCEKLVTKNNYKSRITINYINKKIQEIFYINR